MSDEVLNQFRRTEEKSEKITGRNVRIGIIGCGGIADYHMGIYLNVKGCEIVAACDIVPGKARKLMDKFEQPQVKTDYADHKEMLDDESLHLDAVSVCTYNTQHAPCAIYALKKGINVLCEKPMASSIEEAVEMIRAEKESGKILSIGFQPRFNRNTQLVKQIVESGVLGKIYYIQTGGGRQSGMPGGTFIRQDTAKLGAIGDIGCYGLDMVLNAVGYPKPLTVTGYTSDFFGTDPHYNGNNAKNFEVDDFAAAFVRLEGGIILDFRISWAMHPDTPGDSLILGTEGALRIPSTDCWNDGPGGDLTLYSDICGVQTETKIPLMNSGNCWMGKIGEFVRAVRDNKPAPVSTKEILYNQIIINSIVKSAECGHEIKVEIPEI